MTASIILVWPAHILGKIATKYFRLKWVVLFLAIFVIVGLVTWLLFDIPWPFSLHYFIIAWLLGCLLQVPSIKTEIFGQPKTVSLPLRLSVALMGFMLGVWF